MMKNEKRKIQQIHDNKKSEWNIADRETWKKQN